MAGMTAATPASLLPRPLRVVAGRVLERALNHALGLDPHTGTRLAALEGRRLEMHLRGAELALALEGVDGRLTVGPVQADTPAALRVAATPGSLLAMALRRGDDEGTAPGSVEIAGDADLARRLEKLARQYRPDVEEAFTRTFGDVLGVPLARGFERALRHVRDSARHGSEDLADWLREEAALTPAPAQVDEFMDDVDTLRERSERLEARINRLARQTTERRS
jgi:ubiquinone biosynthesis accessory factor UbiJ